MKIKGDLAELKKCFFCDCIIIPYNVPLMTKEIETYFDKLNIPFTLNYNKSRFKIGNKLICATCERDITLLVTYNQKTQNNGNLEERNL
jgi:hypothetical protein